MLRFDCTTAAGLRDALARTQFEPYDLAEDALRIVGERVVVYANTRSVADLFSSCRELRGLSNAWWRAHADMLKYFEERLYDAAEAEARELPPYTRRLDAGRNDPIGDLEAPPWHPRDYAKHEESLHENNRAPTNQISWKVLKNVGTWTRVLTTRVHLEYLAWLLHPIPGFRVELVKQRHDSAAPSLYTWLVTVPGPQGSFLQNYEYNTIWEFEYGYPYNPPRIVFNDIFHYNVLSSPRATAAFQLRLDVPSGTPWTDVLTDRRHQGHLWNGDYRNRDLMLHLQDFLVNVCEEKPAHEDALRLLRHPSEDHDGLRMDDEARLAYATRLRDSGRAVIRDAAQPFGHRAVQHVVCDPVADEEALDGLLGPERPLDHVVLLKAFSEQDFPEDYPPGSYVP